MPEVLPTLDALLAGATEREPLDRADGLSGATLERVVVDGESYVLKHYDRRNDWLLRATGDAGCRAVALWGLGLYTSQPDCIDSTVVGAAWDPDRGPFAGALLMRDVSGWLIPEGDSVVDLATHRMFLDNLAEQHVAFWGWTDVYGLLPMTTRYQMISPFVSEHELTLAENMIPRAVVGGWARLDGELPSLAGPARALAADPWPLVAALAETPATFLHGDWKYGNLGARDGRTILLDWDRPGEGPPLYDVAWYLAVNCDRLPETKEDAAAYYRAALESRGIDTAPWWDRQYALALLGGFLNLAWSKDGEELEWWARHAFAGLALL